MEQRLQLSQPLALAEYQVFFWYLVQQPTFKGVLHRKHKTPYQYTGLNTFWEMLYGWFSFQKPSCHWPDPGSRVNKPTWHRMLRNVTERGGRGASTCPGVQDSQIRLGGANRCHPHKSHDKHKDVNCGQDCSAHAGVISSHVWVPTKLFVARHAHPQLTESKHESSPLWAAIEGGDAQRQRRGETLLREISAPCPLEAFDKWEGRLFARIAEALIAWRGFADICRQGANESQRPISARTAGLGTVCSIEAFKVFLATRNSDFFFLKLKKALFL